MPISYRAAQNLIKRNDSPALSTALEEGLNPNSTNQNGWTLLMLAAVEGNADIARLLINKGANPASLNRKGESALSIAKQKGHTDFVDVITGA